MLGGLGPEENYERARAEGLGVFIRSLVGMDRQAAIKAFAGFLQGKSLNANQQQFISMLVEELTRSGIMEAGRLFESPFSDVAQSGLETLFGSDGARELPQILEAIRRSAAELVPASA